jgi:Domain of unknown function (DUF1707)
VIEPGDEIAAGAAGGRRMIASRADRDQVLDALKAAFVQGRLTKDEFDQRVGQVLATYAELDALTADIPAAPAETQLPEPARESHNRKVIQRGTAAGAGGSMAFAAAALMAFGAPAVAWVVVPVVGLVMAVLLAGLLTLLSWVLEKGPSRRAAQRPPRDPRGRALQGLASADSAEPPPRRTGHDPRHTAEAARSRRGHVRTPRAAVHGV